MRTMMAVAIGLTAVAASWPAAAAEHVVTMLGEAYTPAAIQAKVGDTIRFVNDDGLDHVVFSTTKGFGIDFGVQKPGQARVLTLNRAGTFEIECVPHVHMHLKVTVSP